MKNKRQGTLCDQCQSPGARSGYRSHAKESPASVQANPPETLHAQRATILRAILTLLALLLALVATTARAAMAPLTWPAGVRAAQFGAGSGPSIDGAVIRLLDATRSKAQSNAVAFDRAQEGAYETLTFRCAMRVLPGGAGGAFVFLATAQQGVRGPAPFVADWTAPNLPGVFAVGVDVYDPKTEEPFGSDGNILGAPERLVSIHWDGREVAKRIAATEFRGHWANVEISLVHVAGGAEVSVRIGASLVFDREFVAGLDPYERRLAMGAATRDDVTTNFDVRDVRFEQAGKAAHRRPPLHVELFNHVRSDRAKTSFEAEVELPPIDWAFSRVLVTLDLHDGGKMWDEWDRNAELSIVLPDGRRLGIVPFITSYRVAARWVVDVTHFRSLLAGKVRFELAAGTSFYKNRGYLISVSLDFHHGVPALEPFRVEPLWIGTAHYGSDTAPFADLFAASRTVVIDPAATSARLFVTTTGHSQVGEFTPSRRAITVRCGTAAPQRFENLLWRDDNWLNPVRPQFGTWKYSRAGWAPGDVVRPWWIDLGNTLAPGEKAEFSYQPYAYEFDAGQPRPTEKELKEANQVVRSYLVLYRPPQGLKSAPTLQILDTVAGGVAAKAGIRAGDYLLNYNGSAVDTPDELRAGIAKAQKAGQASVKITLVRGSERIGLELPAGRLGVQFTPN